MKEFLQGGVAPIAVDQIERGAVGGETPQPMGGAVHPPSGFVGVEHRRLLGFLRQLFVPGANEFGEMMPHRRQASRRKGKLEMVV